MCKAGLGVAAAAALQLVSGVAGELNSAALECGAGTINGTFVSQQALANVCAASCTLAEQAGEEEVSDENFALAFLLVTCAGLSTSIGAALVFVNRCVTKTNEKVLAASLGFSAGVMLYVSFAEILGKSVDAFTDCDCLWEHEDPQAPAKIVATLTFFGGVIFYLLLDALVHCILPKTVIKRKRSYVKDGEQSIELRSTSSQSASATDNVNPPAQQEKCFEDGNGDELAIEDVNPNPIPSTISIDNMDQGVKDATQMGDSSTVEETNSAHVVETIPIHTCIGDDCEDDGKSVVVIDLDALSDEDRAAALNRMGLMTALAIGLHNFPEGLATFAGTLADPSVGIALAVAVAIHNVPEGLCVSIPIYYATGSRCRGFWLATASGLAEIVGAALGYLFLISVFSNAAYGILFGLVAGMMVAIVVSELLPTAQRYDPAGKTATTSFFCGMAVMAISLVLFLL